MTFVVRLSRMPAIVLLMWLFAVSAAAAAQQSEEYSGRSLAQALAMLQAKGLRIVFTSATVTADMRVTREPHAASARQQLDELLAPHGLEARDGPADTIQVVRGRREKITPPAPPAAPRDRAVDERPRSAPAIHREHVTVNAPPRRPDDRGVSSEASLSRAELEQMHGSLLDDPVRVVHAFPGVSAVDDFRGEFAVRGSPFRHVDLVVEGVSTHWLQHTAYGRGATGSLGMVAGEVLETATLRAGAYPRRHSDRLGAQLELTLREGSRSRARFSGTVGGTNATIVGEGPIGRTAPGSWLIALRQSYLEWPTEAEQSSRAAFGFSDGLAKVVYDVRQNHQLSVSVLAGVASIDGQDDPAPDVPGGGSSATSVVNVGWKSSFGASIVLSQRASILRRSFVNKQQSGEDRDRGSSDEMVYRADVLRPIGGGLLEAGARIGRTTIHDVSRLEGAAALGGASSLWSGYVHFAWPVTPAFTLSPGLRITDSSLVPNRAVGRWLLSEWAFHPRWTLTASAGVLGQLPELRHVLGAAGEVRLRPERATHADVGIEHRPSPSIRWQVTAFNRHESDILRDPDPYPRLLDDAIATGAGPYANALRGFARGVELLVDRRRGTGLSGWASYAYGQARQIDSARGETFWSDYDQRHALSVFAAYRFSNRVGVGATFRAASNFPVPGYFEERDGRLFLANHRNRVRLPAYARLDVRADREFKYLGRRVTLFAEALNLLNRANAGIANGSVDLATGEVTAVTDHLFRRRVSAGIRIDF